MRLPRAVAKQHQLLSRALLTDLKHEISSIWDALAALRRDDSLHRDARSGAAPRPIILTCNFYWAEYRPTLSRPYEHLRLAMQTDDYQSTRQAASPITSAESLKDAGTIGGSG